ncbi:MAG: hypothetical protein LBG76_11125, partial [Treponema sp.]|nr:hypothetical protein [Treponema sp.]
MCALVRFPLAGRVSSIRRIPSKSRAKASSALSTKSAAIEERIWVIYRQLSNTLIDNPLGRLYDVLLVQLEKDRVDTNT